jgi:hypothetical protein
MAVAKEMSKCKSDLVGVQEVIPNQQENTHFSMERGMRIMD